MFRIILVALACADNACERRDTIVRPGRGGQDTGNGRPALPAVHRNRAVLRAGPAADSRRGVAGQAGQELPGIHRLRQQQHAPRAGAHDADAATAWRRRSLANNVRCSSSGSIRVERRAASRRFTDTQHSAAAGCRCRAAVVDVGGHAAGANQGSRGECASAKRRQRRRGHVHGGGRYPIVALINKMNQIERVTALLPDDVLGDMPVVTTYSGYRNFGGIQFRRASRRRRAGTPRSTSPSARFRRTGSSTSRCRIRSATHPVLSR